MQSPKDNLVVAMVFSYVFTLDAVISSTGKQAESFKCSNTGIFGCYHVSWLANKKPAI